MDDLRDDEQRIEVWMAMAGHFLDTDTRIFIPDTAMTCVRAGYTPADAFEIWAHEVTPAVCFNLLDIAGEWAGWDRDWLVQRIQSRRARGGWLRRVCRPWRVLQSRACMVGVWASIERCMIVLRSTEPAERERTARHLRTLANHYFDFCPEDLRDKPADERAQLRALRAEATHAFGPAALGVEALLARARLARALDRVLAEP